MIKSYRFQSLLPGPKVAIMGAVHGNETGGTDAIERIAAQIRDGSLSICRGDLLLIPCANEAAYKRGVRQIDENLNRIFMHHPDPRSHEQRVANGLTMLLADRRVLIDIHSIHTKGEPFTFYFDDMPEAEMELISSLGMPVIMEGWLQAYARSMPGVDIGQARHSHAFIRSIGGIGVGIECGLHGDPLAVEVAYNASLRALHKLGIVDVAMEAAPPSKHIRLDSVFFRNEGDVWARDFNHGEPVAGHTLLAKRADGKELRAETDCLVLLPRPDCPVGSEWFYLGREVG